MSTCLDSLHGTNRVVKSRGPGSLADLAGSPGSGEPGTLLNTPGIELLNTPNTPNVFNTPNNRAERTAGGLAVSGVYGREPAGSEGPAGIPWTNSKLPLSRGSFSIRGAVRWLLPGANPLHGAVLGPG